MKVGQGIGDSVLRFKKVFCVSFRYSDKYTVNELCKVLSCVKTDHLLEDCSI